MEKTLSSYNTVWCSGVQTTEPKKKKKAKNPQLMIIFRSVKLQEFSSMSPEISSDR